MCHLLFAAEEYKHINRQSHHFLPSHQTILSSSSQSSVASLEEVNATACDVIYTTPLGLAGTNQVLSKRNPAAPMPEWAPGDNVESITRRRTPESNKCDDFRLGTDSMTQILNNNLSWAEGCCPGWKASHPSWRMHLSWWGSLLWGWTRFWGRGP